MNPKTHSKEERIHSENKHTEYTQIMHTGLQTTNPNTHRQYTGGIQTEKTHREYTQGIHTGLQTTNPQTHNTYTERIRTEKTHREYT